MPVPEGITRKIFIAAGEGSLGFLRLSTWWMARSAGNLRLRLVCVLLPLVLRFFRPRRHDPVHARVGDGLAEVLAKMSRDHEEGTAQGGLPVEHLLWLTGIGVVEGHEGIAEMRERILQS